VGNNYGEILIFSLRDGAYIRSESPWVFFSKKKRKKKQVWW
jgi:hypothetical protein